MLVAGCTEPMTVKTHQLMRGSTEPANWTAVRERRFYNLFGRAVVVYFLVFVKILAAKESDKVPPCLLGGQLIQVLREVTFGGHSYGGFAALFSRSGS